MSCKDLEFTELGTADIFMAVTQLGRGDHSLQPDSPVTHLSIVSRVIPVAWQCSEAVVDLGILVSADCDVWEVDRNGRIIQHIRLILHQRPQVVKGTVILFKPRPLDTVKIFNSSTTLVESSDSWVLHTKASDCSLISGRKVFLEAFSTSWSHGDR